MKQRTLHVVGSALFALGLVLGVAFFGSAVWADIEAFLFDASLRADARLTTLRCPVVVTSREVGEIRATFTNPLDRPIQPRVHIHVTDGYVTLMREEAVYLRLEPGETRQLRWQITTDNAAWDYFILARVYIHRAYPLPSRTATCGVLALDISFLTGAQVVLLVLTLTVLFLGGGFYLWQLAHQPLEGRRLQEARGRAAMIGLVILGTVAGMLGWWTLGLVCFIVLLLLIILMVTRSAIEVG